MSASVREAIPNVGCPGTPLEFPGSMEGRPRSLGAPLGCPGVLGRPSQMFRSGREWSGDPAECPRVVVRPS